MSTRESKVSLPVTIESHVPFGQSRHAFVEIRTHTVSVEGSTIPEAKAAFAQGVQAFLDANHAPFIRCWRGLVGVLTVAGAYPEVTRSYVVVRNGTVGHPTTIAGTGLEAAQALCRHLVSLDVIYESDADVYEAWEFLRGDSVGQGQLLRYAAFHRAYAAAPLSEDLTETGRHHWACEHASEFALDPPVAARR